MSTLTTPLKGLGTASSLCSGRARKSRLGDRETCRPFYRSGPRLSQVFRPLSLLAHEVYTRRRLRVRPARLEASTMTEPFGPGILDLREDPTVDTATGQAPPKITHPDRDARRAAGKAARDRTPLEAHAEFETDGRADPVDLLESQAASRVPDLVPIRYGRMSTSPFALLPRRRAGHGHRPGEDAGLGAAGAAVRRRPHEQLRRVRLAGAAPGVRRERLRRDAPGAVRVGRQAAGGEPRGRRTRQRLLREAAPQDRAAAAAGYREAMRAFATQGNLAVWYATSTWTTS